MDKAKVVPVILLIIVIGVGFVAYNFYAQNLQLTQSNQELRQINTSLEQEKNSLEQRQRRVTSENRELSRRVDSIQQELSQIERERDSLRRRYEQVTDERDQLARELEERPTERVVRTAPERPERIDREAPERSQDYWADFVQERAELAAKVDEFEQKMLEAQSQMAELRKENRELSLNADQARKEKERIEQDISKKERALRIMSMDLVSERQKRGQAVDELKELRSESSGLKRELIAANERKSILQRRLKETLGEKNNLENQISQVENILKEKALTFKDLEMGLAEAISKSQEFADPEYSSVELPPIVVRPDTSGVGDLRGEIIAVNPQERFVVFNLGEESGVRPGVALKVIRDGREVATLEVIETRRNISAADIRDVASGFDIREGDQVRTVR